MRKHFIMAVMYAGLFSPALFSSLAHGSISLIGFTETPLDFTATYSFANDANLFPSTGDKTGLYWKDSLMETFAPVSAVAPASYTLTWTAWHITAPHPGESPIGFPGASFCTFYGAPVTTQPCNQSTALPHPISVVDGALHEDAFNFMLNRNSDGSGTITVTGSHVTATPLPSAIWLLGSGVLSMGGFAWKRRLRSRAIGLVARANIPPV